MSTGVDRENTLEGSRLRGVLKVGDLCLAQHLRELGSPLRADVVAVETADEEKSGGGERVASMSTGADTKGEQSGASPRHKRRRTLVIAVWCCP